MSIAGLAHSYIDDDEAVEHLQHYLRNGAFSGASFETLGRRGDEPAVADRFTAEDLIAITTLSVSVTGWGAIDLLDTRADRFAELLAPIPAGLDLHEASDDDLDPLWELQRELDTVDGVGHVTRSKLLARKRPRLVPIRDQYILTALLGRSSGNFTKPLRDALADDSTIVSRLHAIRSSAGAEQLSILRVLDIVVWMRIHGAASVA